MMDANKLLSSEVDYELAIRGVIGISSGRQRIMALKECLKREAEGSEIGPTSSGHVFTAEEEIGACVRILENLIETVQTIGKDVWVLGNGELESRFIHLEKRLNRIEPQTEDQVTKWNVVKNDLNNLIMFVDKTVKEGRAKGAIRKSLPMKSNQEGPNKVKNVSMQSMPQNVNLQPQQIEATNADVEVVHQSSVHQSQAVARASIQHERRTPEQFRWPVNLEDLSMKTNGTENIKTNQTVLH